jgi:hypothetical protein
MSVMNSANPFLNAIKQNAAGHKCQPWFYLSLKGYCFVGLSEGAYGVS